MSGGAATLNAVARGDLAARLASGRGLRVQTIYLAVCSAFLLLSLPPEIGRLDLREANLLLAFLAVQIVAITYLSSAAASGELGIEAEKGLPDLALSSFSPDVIAVGKALSSALYAVYLLAIALPLFVLAGALRGAPLQPLVWSSVLSFAMATAAGVWGAWLGGRVASDFTRSFVHWTALAALFGGTALLPASWWPANPIRLVDVIVREGPTPALSAVIGITAALVAAGMAAMRQDIRHARAHEDGV